MKKKKPKTIGKYIKLNKGILSKKISDDYHLEKKPNFLLLQANTQAAMKSLSTGVMGKCYDFTGLIKRRKIRHYNPDVNNIS